MIAALLFLMLLFLGSSFHLITHLSYRRLALSIKKLPMTIANAIQNNIFWDNCLRSINTGTIKSVFTLESCTNDINAIDDKKTESILLFVLYP